MPGNRTINMSEEEIKRSEIMRMAEERWIKQKEGARRIGISVRHFRRLLRRYRAQGPEGIISGHRGKPNNNRMKQEKRKKILNKLRVNYHDFGPTFASEELWDLDGIKVSKETVRQMMIQEGLHEAKTKEAEEVHQMRERRKHRGELVQIDGSYHAWLEDRAEKAVCPLRANTS